MAGQMGRPAFDKLLGVGRYRATTTWGGWSALATTALILFGATIAAAMLAILQDALQGLAQPGAPAPSPPPAGSYDNKSLIIMAISQALMILAALYAANWQSRNSPSTGRSAARNTLALNPVSASDIRRALFGLVVLSVIYNLLIQFIEPGAWDHDMNEFRPLVMSSNIWFFIVIVAVGAPLSEEILFRGFLLPALAQTPLGFVGAAVVTSAGWTMLHWGYSLSGMIEVFLMGLYLSWALWRTGSLWTTIACHGTYNFVMILVLWLTTAPATL